MGLRFGLALQNDFPPGERAADRVAKLREQARVATAPGTGIESLWVLQHYLGAMPTLQPLQTLAALVADSGSVDLGTNMFIMPLRHPVEIAEEYATLDHLSGGRAIAGLGLGYRENEFDAFGVSLDSRIARFEEGVPILRSLWAGETVDAAGEYYRIRGEKLSLVPVRPIPIYVGAGPHTAGAKRAARLGDAWIVPPHVPMKKLQRLSGVFHGERETLGLPSGKLVARRELVLTDDPERSRAIGLTARGRLSAAYGQYNAPQNQGDSYKHLESAQAATEVADQSYLFTDPAGAVLALRELAEAGITEVILRAQWFDLAQEQVLSTLEMFVRDVVSHLADNNN